MSSNEERPWPAAVHDDDFVLLGERRNQVDKVIAIGQTAVQENHRVALPSP